MKRVVCMRPPFPPFQKTLIIITLRTHTFSSTPRTRRGSRPRRRAQSRAPPSWPRRLRAPRASRASSSASRELECWMRGRRECVIREEGVCFAVASNTTLNLCIPAASHRQPLALCAMPFFAHWRERQLRRRRRRRRDPWTKARRRQRHRLRLKVHRQAELRHTCDRITSSECCANANTTPTAIPSLAGQHTLVLLFASRAHDRARTPRAALNKPAASSG